jgi:hypothetical protein
VCPLYYPTYVIWVDQVRDGMPPFETTVQLQHLGHMDNKKSAADFLFLDENLVTSLAMVQRAFLSPFNAQVDAFNQLMLSHIPGTSSRKHLSYLPIIC